VTVVLDWDTADWTCPRPPRNCSMCNSRIQPPFVHWWCTNRHILICARCCHWTRHGLMADMTRADAISQGMEALADDQAVRQAQ
jgi:hypothetical protein